MLKTAPSEIAGRLPPRRAALAPHLSAEDVLLTRQEASAYLRVSMPTLERWKRFGHLRGRKIGSRILYSLADLRRFVEAAGP
jgi:excisionase family DNA binding protein